MMTPSLWRYAPRRCARETSVPCWSGLPSAELQTGLTFAGIAPAGVLPFVAAQIAGSLAAIMLAQWLWTKATDEPAQPI